MMDVEELGEVEGSGKKKGKTKGGLDKEETVEDLIAKLEQRGKKVVLHDHSHQMISGPIGGDSSGSS